MNLHNIIKEGKTEELINYINEGNDINAPCNEEECPLHTAAYFGDIEIVKILLDNGAIVDTNNTYTPLHIAANRGFPTIVNMLLDRNANIEAVDEDGNTPLHWAAMLGSPEGITILINRGANINATNYDGKTALHFAACNGGSKAVEILMNSGANIEAICNKGKTALHYAVDNNSMNKNILIGGVKFAYLECIKHLTNESTKEFIENSTPNEQLGIYLKEQHQIATSETTEKSESIETDETRLTKISLKDCAKALLGMKTTDKAKALLKIKIGVLRTGAKDAYTNTLKFLGYFTRFNLKAENINHIIGYAGLYDAKVDLNDILNNLSPKSSREILKTEINTSVLNQGTKAINATETTNFCTIT